MLERVGAVRLAQPGDLERDDAWLQKAFRNQARVASAQPVRVSSAPRTDDGALRRADEAELNGANQGTGAGEGNRTLV